LFYPKPVIAGVEYSKLNHIGGVGHCFPNTIIVKLPKLETNVHQKDF
jgi:hypothetical protein